MGKLGYNKGDVIGQRYIVYEILGKGGCGVVYAVYNRQTNGVYALKTFLDQYMNDKAVSDRFKKEAQVWVALERHPFIVTAFFVENFSGRYHVALEYIPQNKMGWNTLDGYLRHQKPTFNLVLKWAIQFCHGMEHAYSKGIKAHRDIKPANIMIDEYKNIRISDFGLAGIITPNKINHQTTITNFQQTMLGTGMGTPTHMPPEQFTNAIECDERSDIYSFGVVLYQMLAGGRLPFHTENRDQFWAIMKHLHNEMQIPKIDSPLASIIGKCMAKEPSCRYQSFLNLRKKFEALLKSHNGSPVQVPTLPPFDEWEWNNKSSNLNTLGLFDEAIRCANKAISLNPNYDYSWGYKADALHNLGKFNEAIDCYQRMLDLGNNDATTWGNKGLSYRALMQYDKALECYEKALKIEPNEINILNNKGACLAQFGTLLNQPGKLHEAILCYDKALAIDKSFSALWSNKGIALIELGDIENGINCLNKSLSINPNNIGVLKEKAKVLMKNVIKKVGVLDTSKYINDAIAVYSKLFELNPKSIDDLYNLGLCYLQIENLKKAYECFSRVEKLNPNDIGAWFGLMKIFFKKQDSEKTIKYCDKLINAKQHIEEAVNKKARVLSYIGEYSQAVSVLKDTLKIYPNMSFLWFTLSEIQEQNNNFSEALISLTNCSKLLMQNESSSHTKIESINLRIKMLRQKTSKSASPEIKRALQQLKTLEVEHYKQKPHIDVIRHLCQLYLNAGDKQKALHYCDTLIKTTNSITDFGNKALVMSHFGDYDEAVLLLKEILHERPNVDLLWHVLSNIHEKQGNIKEALKAAVKCLNVLLNSKNPNKQNVTDVERKIFDLKNK